MVCAIKGCERMRLGASASLAVVRIVCAMNAKKVQGGEELRFVLGPCTQDNALDGKICRRYEEQRKRRRYVPFVCFHVLPGVMRVMLY